MRIIPVTPKRNESKIRKDKKKTQNPIVKARSRLPSGCVYDDKVYLLIFWIVAPGKKAEIWALE
jgi:hypothetical protein